jgi:hypothetical protein
MVFLAPGELIFVFEGDHAEREVMRLLGDASGLERLGRLEAFIDGEPLVAREVFAWQRLAQLEGFNFSGHPGPGYSEGGQSDFPKRKLS